MTSPCRTTLRGSQGRLRLPPKAARAEGPPRSRPRRIDQSREALYAARPLHSPEEAARRLPGIRVRRELLDPAGSARPSPTRQLVVDLEGLVRRVETVLGKTADL
jgi:hypothetical protein